MKDSIRKISFHALETELNGRPAIVIAGAGGDKKDWIKGVGEYLNNKKVMKGEFSEVLCLKRNGCTDLVMILPEEDSRINVKGVDFLIENIMPSETMWATEYIKNMKELLKENSVVCE